MTLIVARLLTIFVYGVMPSAPLVMAMTAGALAAVTLIATYIPARSRDAHRPRGGAARVKCHYGGRAPGHTRR
jgi:hypothetical protein